MRGMAKIRHLVAHARPQREAAAVAQFCDEFAFQHVEHVSAVAPVIGEISGCVLDHTDAYVANIEGAPERTPAFTGMRGGGNLAPIGDGEGQRWNLHSAIS